MDHLRSYRRRYAGIVAAGLLAAAICKICGDTPLRAAESAVSTKQPSGGGFADGDFVVVADRTGTTEAAAAFNAAIDAAALAGGGIVRVPQGVYWVSGASGSRICLKSRVTLEFEPGCSVRSDFQSGNSVLIEINTANASLLEDVAIHGNGLRLVGDRSRPGIQYGISINVQHLGDRMRRVQVRDVLLSGFRTDGLQIGGNRGVAPAEDISLERVAAEDCFRNGFSVLQVRGLQLWDCRATGTRGAAPEAGVDVEPDAGLVVEGVEIRGGEYSGNAAHGIYLQAGHGRTVGIGVRDVRANRNGGSGIAASGVAGLSIVRCETRENARSGLGVSLCDRVAIDECRSAQNGADGLSIVANRGCDIFGTSSSGNQANGFLLSSDPSLKGFVRAVGCLADGNRSRGFCVSFSTCVALEDSVAVRNGQEGIQLFNASECTITGNFVAENSQVAGDRAADNIVVESHSHRNSFSRNVARQALRYSVQRILPGGGGSLLFAEGGAPTDDDYYRGMSARVVGVAPAGSANPVVAYSAANRSFRFENPWVVIPRPGYSLEISVAARPRFGLRINAGCSNNFVAGNELEGGGADGALADAGEFTGSVVGRRTPRTPVDIHP